MKKILIAFFVILTVSSCTVIPGGKEFEETLNAIRENIHRYKNLEKGNWTFVTFVRCDSNVSKGGSITCMQERTKFQIFRRNSSLI